MRRRVYSCGQTTNVLSAVDKYSSYLSPYQNKSAQIKRFIATPKSKYKKYSQD